MMVQTKWKERNVQMQYVEKVELNLKIVMFYTEIWIRKFVLWYFFTSETSEKSTIQLF